MKKIKIKVKQERKEQLNIVMKVFYGRTKLQSLPIHIPLARKTSKGVLTGGAKIKCCR